jgi:Protein of unknown function (DUF1194)
MHSRAWGILAPAVLVVAVAGLGLAFAASAPSRFADLPGSRVPGSVDVDVELVLAVDISYSMDLDELALQREGYVEALTSPEFLNALQHGMHGRVAVSYVEWAGAIDQKLVLPWKVIDGRASAETVAAQISRAPTRRAYRTSISGALTFSASLFDESGYRGIRRVIDVSGDGTNNQGPLVAITRDEVVAKGITINGLPIMLKRPNPSTLDIPDLDIYYEDCVIGGPGAFVVPVRERDKFRDAIRTKLVLEIAGRVPEPRVVPAAADAPRISCTIGERMWQQRWGSVDR